MSEKLQYSVIVGFRRNENTNIRAETYSLVDLDRKEATEIAEIYKNNPHVTKVDIVKNVFTASYG